MFQYTGAAQEDGSGAVQEGAWAVYSEILFFVKALEGRPIWPQEARAMVARATDAFQVDPAIFHRQTDGKPRQGMVGDAAEGEGWGVPPLVIFGGGQGLIRMVGLSQEGVELVEKTAPIVGTALSMMLESPYTFKRRSGECALKESSGALVYSVKTLALSKKRNAVERAKSPSGEYTLESVDALIRRAVIGGIISEARFLDERDGGSRESVIGTDDMLGLTVHEGTPTFVPVKREQPVHALAVSNLVFTMNLDVKGMWYGGILRSHGMGLMRRVWGR